LAEYNYPVGRCSADGVWKPVPLRQNGTMCGALLRPFFYWDDKQTPDFGSGGHAEYKIRGTIQRIVSNLLTTKSFWWFLFEKTRSRKNETKSNGRHFNYGGVNHKSRVCAVANRQLQNNHMQHQQQRNTT